MRHHPLPDYEEPDYLVEEPLPVAFPGWHWLFLVVVGMLGIASWLIIEGLFGVLRLIF